MNTDRIAGRTVALEGLDGAGKTTQVRMVAAKISALGIPCETTKLMRADLVEHMLDDMDAESEVSDLSSRFAVISKLLARQEWLIGPMTKSGTTIIHDKYALTFIASEIVRGADRGELEVMTRRLEPADLTVLIEISPRVALARKNGVVGYRECGLNLFSYRGEPGNFERFSDGGYPEEWLHDCYLRFQGQILDELRGLMDGQGMSFPVLAGQQAVVSGDAPSDAITESICKEFLR
jgi:thymidylate kinase